jgi:molybdopterin/thiamine biosynthesis adenylyltransferase
MIKLKERKKNLVMLPELFMVSHYEGDLFGNYFDTSGVFNIFSPEMLAVFNKPSKLGKIVGESSGEDVSDAQGLLGIWQDDNLSFTYQGVKFKIEKYNLIQNIFSRNTGILESDTMREKCAFMIGCGSVGSLITLELARAGVGKFVLIDHDILEYHNLCRHQCSIREVGEYKVYALKRRIQEINPGAQVECVREIVEHIPAATLEKHCDKNSIIVASADNRAADVYANSIAAAYAVPFLSVGLWERAFAGEIFYYLPNSNMPCYNCALGDDGGLSRRINTNRRIYTNQKDLAKINFEPGISVDINFVTMIGIKLILDILNIGNEKFTPRLLDFLKPYTLVCNTNKPEIGGEMAEIFYEPLQITTSLEVDFHGNCPPCEYAPINK